MEILIYILVGLLFLGGILLTIFTLPGVWLVYIGVLLLATLDSFTVITPTLLVILFLLSLLSTFVDNIVIALGAKKLGGSNWGMFGAIVGGIVGMIIGNFVGMLLGPLLGATIFEIVFAKKELKDGFKAGIGSFIGVFVSILLRFVFTVAMAIYALTVVF